MNKPAVGALKTVITFTPEKAYGYPEGLAIDRHGNIYVGLLTTGEVIKITPDGTRSVMAKFELGITDRKSPNVLVGLAADGSDNVYAVLLTGNAPGADTHGIWRISPDGTKELAGAIPDITGGPNQVALDARGNIYVTDSWLGIVWRIAVDSKVAQAWLNDRRLLGATDIDNPCGITTFSGGANGLAFDADGVLYVASSNRAIILRVNINPETGAPDAHEFVQDCSRLTDLDHMAFDVEGNLYVARNNSHELIRISPECHIDVLATLEDGLDVPSNVTFGTGPAAFGTGANNRTMLYITNHGARHGRHCLLVTDVGIAGLPMPMPTRK